MKYIKLPVDAVANVIDNYLNIFILIFKKLN